MEGEYSSSSASDSIGACPLCGAPGAGGLDGCLERFGTLGAREFSDPAYFAVHRLTVDAYCLQHPELYMISSKSAATHLAAMCWSLERGLTRNLNSRLKAFFDGPRSFARLEPPAPRHRGRITIADLMLADTPASYEASAWQWARSAWEAWRDHWELAREWVDQACDADRPDGAARRMPDLHLRTNSRRPLT